MQTATVLARWLSLLSLDLKPPGFFSNGLLEFDPFGQALQTFDL